MEEGESKEMEEGESADMDKEHSAESVGDSGGDSPASYCNPEPPPELAGQLLNADNIGETVFSKHWLFTVLMKLIQAVDAQENGKESQASGSSHDLDIDEDLQDELCKLWDMSMNTEVVTFLQEFKAIEILTGVIATSRAPRATEICVGILGNMACTREVCVQLSQSQKLRDLLLLLFQNPDAPTLVELTRLLHVCISCPEAATFWVNSVKNDNSVFTNVSFILQSSTNNDLLRSTGTFVDSLLYCDDEICQMWGTAEMVLGVLEALKQTGCVPGSEGLDTFLHILQLVSTCETGVEALVSYGSDLIDLTMKYLVGICEEDLVGIDGKENSIASALSVLNVLVANWEDRHKFIQEDFQLVRCVLKILEELYPRYNQSVSDQVTTKRQRSKSQCQQSPPPYSSYITQGGTPSKTGKEAGTPSKITRDSGTPSKITRDSGTPSKNISSSGTPSKTGKEGGTPSKISRDSGTPVKIISDSGTPIKITRDSGTPSKKISSSGTPSKIITSNGTPPSEQIKDGVTPTELNLQSCAGESLNSSSNLSNTQKESSNSDITGDCINVSQNSSSSRGQSVQVCSHGDSVMGDNPKHLCDRNQTDIQVTNNPGDKTLLSEDSLSNDNKPTQVSNSVAAVPKNSPCESNLNENSKGQIIVRENVMSLSRSGSQSDLAAEDYERKMVRMLYEVIQACLVEILVVLKQVTFPETPTHSAAYSLQLPSDTALPFTSTSRNLSPIVTGIPETLDYMDTSCPSQRIRYFIHALKNAVSPEGKDFLVTFKSITDKFETHKLQRIISEF